MQLRVSIFPTVYGEKIVCRIFNPEAKIFDITKLGFDDETLVRFKEVVSKPTGLILLTGPTGSGKTTAIYAAIGFLLDKHGNLLVIETPGTADFGGIAELGVEQWSEAFVWHIELRVLLLDELSRRSGRLRRASR